MKQCPQCSARYDDGLSFCPKDGRALLAKREGTSRLCPHCANSIAEDAVSCPYCKAEIAPAPAPQWPIRDDALPDAAARPKRKKISAVSLVAFILGVIFFAAGIVLNMDQSPAPRPPSTQDNSKEVQERDQRIQSLEGELSRVRQELTERSEEANELKTKLDETQKDLTTMQQRTATANREIERATSRPQQSPQPVREASAPAPPPPPPPRRAAQPGTYETLRSTTVFEEPSGTSRVLTKIARGTRVEVVRSSGDWLEVRSKHGNPPGFVRADDTVFVSNTR